MQIINLQHFFPARRDALPFSCPPPPQWRSDGVGRMGKVQGAPECSPGTPEFQVNFFGIIIFRYSLNYDTWISNVRICFISTLPT